MPLASAPTGDSPSGKVVSRTCTIFWTGFYKPLCPLHYRPQCERGSRPWPSAPHTAPPGLRREWGDLSRPREAIPGESWELPGKQDGVFPRDPPPHTP